MVHCEFCGVEVPVVPANTVTPQYIASCELDGCLDVILPTVS